MKNGFFLLVVTGVLSSCQFFETEKIPSETFYASELNTIDWYDVDQYPLFKDCEESSEKNVQKSCFENTLITKMYQSINEQDLIASTHSIDTLFLTMLVSQDGTLSIKELKIDSLTQRSFPKLEHLILQAIDSMQLVAPAYKRGIPVTTQFTLPVVLQSE